MLDLNKWFIPVLIVLMLIAVSFPQPAEAFSFGSLLKNIAKIVAIVAIIAVVAIVAAPLLAVLIPATVAPGLVVGIIMAVGLGSALVISDCLIPGSAIDPNLICGGGGGGSSSPGQVSNPPQNPTPNPNPDCPEGSSDCNPTPTPTPNPNPNPNNPNGNGGGGGGICASQNEIDSFLANNPGDAGRLSTVFPCGGGGGGGGSSPQPSSLPPPSCSLSVVPGTVIIPPPRRVDMSWFCTGSGVSCSVSANPGGCSNGASASCSFYAQAPETFTLTCTNAGGSDMKTAKVRVFTFGGGSLKEVSPGQ